jgi:hypothetical protein
LSVVIQLIPNQTGGQRYSDASPFSIPRTNTSSFVRIISDKGKKVFLIGAARCAEDKQEELKNFGGFKISKILSENSERKNVVVEGTFEGGRRSVVVLERLPIRREILPEILNVSFTLNWK